MQSIRLKAIQRGWSFRSFFFFCSIQCDVLLVLLLLLLLFTLRTGEQFFFFFLFHPCVDGSR